MSATQELETIELNMGEYRNPFKNTEELSEEQKLFVFDYINAVLSDNFTLPEQENNGYRTYISKTSNQSFQLKFFNGDMYDVHLKLGNDSFYFKLYTNDDLRELVNLMRLMDGKPETDKSIYDYDDI